MSSYSHRHPGTRPNADLAEAARKIIAASDVEICGPLAYDEPTLEDTAILFNGSEDLDEDWGTFAIAEHTGYGEFCNTALRLYDEVVVAVLVHAILTDNGRVLSDGTFDYWQKGIDLYERAIRPLTDTEMTKVQETIGTTAYVPLCLRRETAAA